MSAPDDGYYLSEPFEFLVISSPGAFTSRHGRHLHKIYRATYEHLSGAVDVILYSLYGPILRYEAAVSALEANVEAQISSYRDNDALTSLHLLWNVEMGISQSAYSFGAYVDAMKSRCSLLYGEDSDQFRRVTGLMSEAYDSNLEYRVAGQVRNVLAHSSEPLLDPQVFLGAETPSLLVRMNKRVFVNSRRLNRKVKDEVEGIDGDIEMIAVFSNLRHILRELDPKLKHVLYPQLDDACEVVNDFVEEARKHGGFPQVVHHRANKVNHYIPLQADLLDFVANRCATLGIAA